MIESMIQTSQVRALVTGVGAIIGYGVIKSLRKSNMNVYIVGMDIYDDAVGQHWCDDFIKAKYAVDPDYLNFLQEVVEQYKIDIVFFGTEQEIYRVNQEREMLGKFINKLVVNKSAILNLSKDKWMTREYLINHNLEDLAIPSVIEGDYFQIAKIFGQNILLKPRSSYASKGIVTVSDEQDFEFYKAKMGKNFMAQMLIGDAQHEYTVGVFGLGDGNYSGRIILRRTLSQEGSTAKAEVVEEPLLDQCLKRLCDSLKPIGPTNFQFRRHEGRFLLLEVNPRISSSTSLRMEFGYNEAEMCVEYFLHGNILMPQIKKGRAVRYIDEVVVFL